MATTVAEINAIRNERYNPKGKTMKSLAKKCEDGDTITEDEEQELYEQFPVVSRERDEAQKVLQLIACADELSAKDLRHMAIRFKHI